MRALPATLRLFACRPAPLAGEPTSPPPSAVPRWPWSPRPHPPLLPRSRHAVRCSRPTQRHGNPATDHEFWRHRVGGPPFSGSDLLALADVSQRDRLMQVKGVNGNGYALCCGPESAADYTCLRVTAESAELDREQLARDLAVIFARASHLDYDVIVFEEGLGRFSSAAAVAECEQTDAGGFAARQRAPT